jgi:phage-related minor tail protein
MDEEIDRLIVSVRTDTQGFARDVAAMREILSGPLGSGIEQAGALLENTFVRALRTGRLGFEDLKSVALSVLAQIASSAIRSGLGAIFGGGGGQSNDGNSSAGGLLTIGAQVLSGLLGAPGRATGGPVSPGRPFIVGERGPEIFVPTTSGSISANGSGSGGTRDVRVSIAINAPGGSAPDALARSSRQVARAVRSALQRED